MICAKCNFDNPEGSQYCNNCGVGFYRHKSSAGYIIFIILFVIIMIIMASFYFKSVLDTSGPIALNTESAKKHTITSKPLKPDLEVIQHKTISDEFCQYVTGMVKNNTKKTYSYVQVEINLFDQYDNLVGSTLDNVNNLEPGQTWSFKAVIIKDDVVAYKIAGITGW